MTRFAIDAPVAVRLAGEDARLGSDHQLVGPGSLRSDVLALLYRQVRAGHRHEAEALALLDTITSMRMRLLSDRVSRRVAWEVAAGRGLPDTRLAEYVAVAKLQADVLVTEDGELGHAAEGHVRTAGWGELAQSLG